MDDEYAGICGITKEELLTHMSEDIDVLAEAQGLKREETIAKLKEFYDGYHFSPASPDVFNPFSLLNCFTKKNFGAYWFCLWHPHLNMMKKFEVLPSDISRVEADESEFDAPTENMPTIMPLLYLEEQEKILEKIASKDTKIITEGFRYLFLSFLCIRQEAGDDAQQWQEGAHLEDELDARLVGKPSEEGGAKTAQAKHQSEKDTCDQSHLVWH